MKKYIVFAMLVFLSLSLVSAHSNYYNVEDDYTYKEKIVESKYYPEEHRMYSRTTYINYDNDKRYSTYDYRHGYSYRTTIEYRDNLYQPRKYYDKHSSKDLYDYKHYDYKHYDYDNKDYYYKYIPYLKTYERKECYHEAPRDKLFYIRCP